MMFKKIRDILDYLQEVHTNISAYYHQLADSADKEKVLILINHLQEHNDRFKKIVSRYEKEEDKNQLDTWIQYSPQNMIDTEIEIKELDHKMTIDEVLEKALKLDDWLENYYEYIADNAPSTKLKEEFHNLYQNLHQDRLELVSAFNSLKEM
jgi:hypothetical protein